MGELGRGVFTKHFGNILGPGAKLVLKQRGMFVSRNKGKTVKIKKDKSQNSGHKTRALHIHGQSQAEGHNHGNAEKGLE